MYEPKLIFVCKPLYTRTPSVPNRTNLSDLVTWWNTTKAISRAREDSVLNFDFHRQRNIQKWIIWCRFRRDTSTSRRSSPAAGSSSGLRTWSPVSWRRKGSRRDELLRNSSKHFSLGSWPPQITVSIAQACHGVHSQHLPHHHGEGVLANQWGKCTT